LEVICFLTIFLSNQYYIKYLHIWSLLEPVNGKIQMCYAELKKYMIIRLWLGTFECATFKVGSSIENLSVIHNLISPLSLADPISSLVERMHSSSFLNIICWVWLVEERRLVFIISVNTLHWLHKLDELMETASVSCLLAFLITDKKNSKIAAQNYWYTTESFVHIVNTIVRNYIVHWSIKKLKSVTIHHWCFVPTT